jgi:Flp pilus assembly protein TadG
VIVFVLLIFVVMVGMAALVIDVGSWYHAQRKLQTAVDAAALAGAQELPTSPSTASTVAKQYAQNNYAGMPVPTVTFPDPGTIDVQAQAATPGIFVPVFERILHSSTVHNVVTVHAHAQAQVSVPLFMKNVAPVAVKNTVACAVTNPSCYGQTLTLSFDESQVSSSTIGLIKLTCHSTASTACGSSSGIGGSQLKDWIESGYQDALPANQWYGVKTGETVGPVKQGFMDRVGVPLFFPVFDQVANSGSSYFFHVIGWAAFVIDANGVDWGSHTRQLTGHFTTFIATDLASGGTVGGATDFGVHVITLTK